MQNQDQNNLYRIIKDIVPKNVLSNKNRAHTWSYGYNEKYDIVIISKDGTLGEIYEINGLKVGLPLQPKDIIKRSEKKEEQYWEASELHKDLKRIKSIFQWHETPDEFKGKWVDYIEKEFDRREYGTFFMNNGVPTYITGTHYMYLQWTKIDVLHQSLSIVNTYNRNSLYVFTMDKD